MPDSDTPSRAEGEKRLVVMEEVLSVKTGEVVRYSYPCGMSAETWWENGITEEERRAVRDELRGTAPMGFGTARKKHAASLDRANTKLRSAFEEQSRG